MLDLIDAHATISARTFALAPATTSSIDELEQQLTTLAGHLNAGNYRFLELLAEFDRRGGHVGWGIASCAHWLTWKCGIGLVAAREKVRVARALEGLPRLGAAMRRGVLSYCKIRALTRIATTENEDYLLSIAAAGTVSHVEKTVRLCKIARSAPEGARARRRASAIEKWRVAKTQAQLGLRVDARMAVPSWYASGWTTTGELDHRRRRLRARLRGPVQANANARQSV